MSKQSATFAAGQSVNVNGKPATINSIRGRWVNVQFADGPTKNVGFKDVTAAPAAASGDRKNGVVKANYLSNYQRVKLEDGSVVRDNGDDAAQMVRGLDIGEIYSLLAKKLGITKKSIEEQYAHLNVGMQKMNCTNRLRKALRDADKEFAKA